MGLSTHEKEYILGYQSSAVPSSSVFISIVGTTGQLGYLKLRHPANPLPKITSPHGPFRHNSR
jgi:hypothetical protein